MSSHLCPVCGAPMRAEFKASSHPAIPDRTILTCTVYACYYTCSEDDLAFFDPALFAAPIRTSEARRTLTGAAV